MLFVEVEVGNLKTVKQWVAVVPDEYIGMEVLLGCDILGHDKYSVDARRRIMVWGGAPYVVIFIQLLKRHVERARPGGHTAPHSTRPDRPPHAPGEAGPVSDSFRSCQSQAGARHVPRSLPSVVFQSQ